MIEEVFILGQIGKAFYEQDDRYYVVGLGEGSEAAGGRAGEPLECRAGDVAFFFDSGAECSVLSGGDISLDTVRKTLEFSSQAHDALTMSLSGLNSELSPQSRHLSIEAAEELLQAEPVRAFVRARLLARLLPEVADMDGALKYAADAGALTVFAIYEEVWRSQKTISFLSEACGEVGTEFFPLSPEEAAEAERILIESGVFAEMTAAAAAGETSRLGSIVVAYGMKPELKSALPRCVQLLNAIRTRLQQKVEAAPVKSVLRDWRKERETDGETVKFEGVEAVQSDEHRSALLRKLIAAFDKRDRNWRRSRGFEVEERINNQIESIGKLIRRGDLERAHEFLRGLLEFQLEHSRKEHVAMSLCALAKIAMDANALEMADELVDYAFALEVEDVVIWNTRAEILKATGQVDAALDAYEEAMQRFPNDVVARNGYAEALKAKGDFDAALGVYEETMRRFPDDVFVRNGYAEALKAKGDFDAALDAYEETMRRFPDNAVARTGYAEALKAKGDFDAALDAFAETMQRFPDNVVACNGYAEALKAKGDFDAALDAYEETMRRFPDNAVARTGYAEALKAKGDFDAALDAYEETMRRFPNDVVARNGYAEALKAKGDFDAALNAYEETMRRFSDNIVAHTGYAEALKAKGDFDAALDAFAETMQRFPNDVVACNGYAEALKATGQVDAALDAYEEAMQRFPNDVVARNGYAEALKAKGDFDAALDAYEETMRRFPDNAVARNGCASLLVTMKNFHEAESLLSYLSGIHLVTREHWIGYHILAMSSLKRGDTDEAIRRLEYGWKNTQWSDTRNYFATALGLARIRRKEFGPAIEILKDNVVSLDVFQRQKRLALIGHSQAEWGLKNEARDTLAQVTNVGGPLVLDLKGNLIRRFALDSPNAQDLTIAEIADLKRKIDDDEEQLAMAA